MERKLVVLIVEDHAGVRDALERMVESWASVDLLSCNGFVGATQWISTAPRIDLMLCDVYLPDGMTGVDLAEIAVRTHPRIAVVMTSADPQPRVDGFTNRYSFLRKPFGHDDLLAEIDRAFARINTQDVPGDAADAI